MAPEVRVSGPNNEAIGVLSLAEALRMAGELDVDLVEISPTAVPPVCRLMDYGKFKYQEQKKAAEAKSKQKVIEVKEIKFRPGTSSCATSNAFWTTAINAKSLCDSEDGKSPTRKSAWRYCKEFGMNWPT